MLIGGGSPTCWPPARCRRCSSSRSGPEAPQTCGGHGAMKPVLCPWPPACHQCDAGEHHQVRRHLDHGILDSYEAPKARARPACGHQHANSARGRPTDDLARTHRPHSQQILKSILPRPRRRSPACHPRETHDHHRAWPPPWLNTSIVLEDPHETAIASVPSWQRRRLLKALRDAGFELN